MTPQRSDHFNGKTFFQPGARPDRGFKDVLRWKFTSKPARWPTDVTLKPQACPPVPEDGRTVLTWLGHASWLMQSPAGNVLFDPVFSERVSPVRWAGPRRVHPVPLRFEQLPRIDVVCVSHDHYDHCDVATLRQLAATSAQPRFVAPLRHGDLLRAVGATNTSELDWHETHTTDRGLRITLTPTKHWTKRLGTPRNHRLWGGFWAEWAEADLGLRNEKPVEERGAPGLEARRPDVPLRDRTKSIWFVGDSGFDGAMVEDVRRRYGKPEVALVPIGAYEPRWFMGPMHMNPAEAVALHQLVGAKLSLGMHWGTFQLTDEAREEPVRALAAARQAQNVAPESFRVLDPGESVRV